MRPQLAANRTGSAVVVWHAKSGDKAHVYSKVLDRSKQWGRTVDLNMGKSAFIKSTEVAMDGNGNGVAVWSAGNGKSKGATSVQEVWCARFTAGDGWSRPSQLGSAQRRLAQRSTGCRDQ